MAGRPGLEELELTGEEVARLRRAFQDEGFRRLFAEYAAEVSDPAQRAAYEAEVVALERRRGVEARFLHPSPGWVLRTSQAGARRCYLNVCGNEAVGRPQSRPEPGGARWTLPHCLSPGRQELGGRRGPDRRRGLHVVYDVLFHPEALRLAARSPRFRRLVDETALEAVERQFSPGLDRANARPLRGTKYKGLPHAALLRTPLPAAAAAGADPPQGQEGDDDDSPLPPVPTPYAYPPPAPPAPPPEPLPAPAAATTPRWTLRQRSYVDLQDYRCSRDSAPSPVPRELEVTVELPLLASAAQAQLEVRGRELRLDSRRPAAAYRLRLRLPYAVDEDGGRATFDKSRRRLVVTLPVRRPPQPAFLAGPREEEEAPGSGDSPSSLEPPEGSCAVPGRPSTSDQPSVATHVGTNHVELPVCAGESGPLAVGASGTLGEPAATCPARLDVPLGPSAELPGDPATSDPLAPDAARCSRLEASARDGSPGSGAPEGAATSARGSKCPQPDCISLAPEARLGDGVEPPARPGIPGPPAVAQVGLGTAMDLQQCPEVADAVPVSELDDATGLCGVSSGHPVTTERHDRSNPDQKVQTCPRRDGTAGNPGGSSSLAAPAGSPSADLSVMAVSATDSQPGSLLGSGRGLDVDPEPAPSPSSSPDSPLPASRPPPPLCPPFQCTQDEEALVLLLQVPGILPQSLKGEVGTHHYRVGFASKDSASYSLLLQLPAENKLTSPESSLSVSVDNAVVHLTKAPGTTGLWTKLYFGLNEDALQEKLLVTEDNVAGFLDSLQRLSHPSQPEVERQPLIEVLELSEGQSRIRLKAREQNSPEAGQAEEKRNPGTEDSEHPSRAVTGPGGEPATQAEKAPDSLAAAETKEPAGWGRGHCVEPDPADSSLAARGKSPMLKFQESELALAADWKARDQTPLGGGERAGTGEEVCSDSPQGGGSPAPAPVLRERDTRDGSVQLIGHHTTHCPLALQNPLLYELD